MKNQKKENSVKPTDSGMDPTKPGGDSQDPGLLSGTVYPGSRTKVFDRESLNACDILISNIGHTPLCFYCSDPPGYRIPAESWMLQPGRSMAWGKGVDHGRCLYVLNPHKDRQGFFTVKLN